MALQSVRMQSQAMEDQREAAEAQRVAQEKSLEAQRIASEDALKAQAKANEDALKEQRESLNKQLIAQAKALAEDHRRQRITAIREAHARFMEDFSAALPRFVALYQSFGKNNTQLVQDNLNVAGAALSKISATRGAIELTETSEARADFASKTHKMLSSVYDAWLIAYHTSKKPPPVEVDAINKMTEEYLTFVKKTLDEEESPADMSGSSPECRKQPGGTDG